MNSIKEIADEMYKDRNTKGTLALTYKQFNEKLGGDATLIEKYMTHYESVRQKIQAVIPEIEAEDAAICELWDELNDKGNSVWGKIDRKSWTVGHKLFNREITLADVLRAIHTTGRHFSVDDFGTFYEYKGDDERYDGAEEWTQIFGGKRYTWHLADLFDQQSTETLEFLDEILK